MLHTDSRALQSLMRVDLQIPARSILGALVQQQLTKTCRQVGSCAQYMMTTHGMSLGKYMMISLDLLS